MVPNEHDIFNRPTDLEKGFYTDSGNYMSSAG